MATLADIRRAALALPLVIETSHLGGAWFQIGKSSFVLFWPPHGRWIFKLPKPQQEMLFEVRPEVFQPYRAGAMLWSYVDIAQLKRAEATHYVEQAWTMVAPKKVLRAFLEERAKP